MLEDPFGAADEGLNSFGPASAEAIPLYRNPGETHTFDAHNDAYHPKFDDHRWGKAARGPKSSIVFSGPRLDGVVERVGSDEAGENPLTARPISPQVIIREHLVFGRVTRTAPIDIPQLFG
jgi:hypothetical protein